ncbi:unnamed protein product [Ectocarpus fasciculatus]
MNANTLDDAVARAQAREARESVRANQDVQSYHLGGPPEPWEAALGDTGERVGRQGRTVVEYAAKMNAMGINEKSLAGENNPIADHVATIGQDKMRLLSSNPVVHAPTMGDLGGTPSSDAVAEEDDDGAVSVSSGWSEVSDESTVAPSQAQKDSATAAAASRGESGENDDESCDGLDLIDDPDIRNAVEDFDSRNWTMDQLEVSCQTLLEECYASEDRRRRLLSAGMLRKLVEIYPSALRYTFPRWIAQYRELPGAIATHKRMTLLMQGAELRTRWRRINADEKHGSLPASLLHAYLCIILALIDTDTCPRFCRMNRVKVVGGCGLLALSVHFKAGDRSQRLACRILRELAREPLLIFELLNAGVAEYLSRLLPKLRETSIDRLLEALDAVDSMAFSAMRFCKLRSANPSRGQGNSALIAALVADGSSIGGLESEIRLPDGDKLATTVCYHSVLQEMLAYAGRALELLVQGVQSQEEIVPDMSLALFLQLCSRQEGRDGIEATDGMAMLRPLISGAQAQDSPVFLRGLACAVAIAQQGVPGSAPGSTGESATPSATAPPGLSLPKAGGVGRSGPPKPHPLDFEGKLYDDLVGILDAPPPAPLNAVRGLVRMGSLEAVMRFLVREDDGEEYGTDDDESVSLSGGGGAGRTRKNPGGRSSGPHYFRLTQRHACLGAVALHGLAVLAGPHPAIMTDSTLRYLCYSIQIAYIDLTVGTLAPGVDYPLMFRSIQLACRALAFLATSGEKGAPTLGDREPENGTVDVGRGQAEEDGQHSSSVIVDHGPLRRVADSLLSTTAINEVACLAQMPSRAAWAGDEGHMYRHLERTVSSAAILIAGVCPVPAGERNPFSRFDEPEDEPSSLQLCQPLMERLVTTLGGSLCSTLMVAESLEIIAHACRALAKLSDTNTTVQMLLDTHDVMKAVIRLGPRAPAVLPVAAHSEREEARRGGSLSPSRSARSTHGEGRLLPANREPTKGPGGEQAQTTATDTRESSVASEGEDNESRRRGDRVGRKDLGGCSGGLSAPQPPCNGYGVREGEMADASTRKLCSLPFDYFRLVANIARVPSGRAVVQSSGTLKRCLERLALDVSGCPAARLATLRCRSEICVLIGRMAGTYDRKTGAANEFILHPRYQTLRVLLGMLATRAEHGRLFGATRVNMELARHNAAYALGAICTDTIRSVPMVADAGGVHLACSVANDVNSPMPLLKQVLRILHGAGSFPDGAYASLIADPPVLRSLNRIANNAYPGFRPETTSGRDSRPTSSASVRKRAQTPPVLKPRGDGAGGKVDARERMPVNLMPSLLKPRSAESRLISDLATEVAYLVGARANKRGSPRIPASPSGPEESAMPCQHQKARYLTSKNTAEATEPRLASGQKRVEAESDHPSLTNPATAVESQGGHEGIGKTPQSLSVTTTVEDKAVSGRPGTYSGCGVTSCKGLGFAGEHGDVAGNTPHATFVVRNDDRGKRGGESEAYGTAKKQTPAAHLGSDNAGAQVHNSRGSIAEAEPIAEAESIAEAEAIAESPGVVTATPLALLSAREASFRDELIRRKEHYNLGGTRKKGVNRGKEEGGGSPQALATVQKPCGMPETPMRGRGIEASRQPQSTSRKLRGRSPTPVVIFQSPLIASTRPAGFPPGLECRPSPERDKTDRECRHGVDRQESRKNAVSSGSECAPGGKEFVKFARPAAHWSVTNSLSASPGRTRSKGVRIPNSTESGGVGVVGRFASRGYLLDPTFQDHNPVILHPRLPLIGGGGGRGFSQVPDGSTLTELVKSPAAKGGAKGTEPYRNSVEVLRHRVGVSGERKAGKQSCFNEQGLPLSPGKLQQA